MNQSIKTKTQEHKLQPTGISVIYQYLTGTVPAVITCPGTSVDSGTITPATVHTIPAHPSMSQDWVALARPAISVETSSSGRMDERCWDTPVTAL